MVAMMANIPNLGRFPGWRLRFAINPVIRFSARRPRFISIRFRILSLSAMTRRSLAPLPFPPIDILAVRLHFRPVLASVLECLVWMVVDLRWIV